MNVYAYVQDCSVVVIVINGECHALICQEPKYDSEILTKMSILLILW